MEFCLLVKRDEIVVEMHDMDFEKLTILSGAIYVIKMVGVIQSHVYSQMMTLKQQNLQANSYKNNSTINHMYSYVDVYLQKCLSAIDILKLAFNMRYLFEKAHSNFRRRLNKYQSSDLLKNNNSNNKSNDQTSRHQNDFNQQVSSDCRRSMRLALHW